MKTRFLFAFLFFAFLGISQAATTYITATVTVTNGTSNGKTLTVNGDTRTWTNSVSSASTQILTNSTASGAAANMLNAVAANAFTNVSLTWVPTGMKLHAIANSNLTVTVSAGWATVTMATNTTTEATILTLPLSDANASILRGAVLINDWVYQSFYPHDSATNYWLDFGVQELVIQATNDVHLALSTNRPPTGRVRVSGLTLVGGTADHGLTWDSNYFTLLGITNASLTIPSNKVARASFMVISPGTNAIWGWSVQQ